LEFLRQTPQLAYQTIERTAAEPAFHWEVALLSTAVVLAGIGLAAFFYLGEQTQIDRLSRLVRPLYALSHGKFFFDQIYQVLVVWPLRGLAALSYWIDRYVIDALVNLVGAIPAACGAALRSLQNGMVQFYALAMMLGLLVLIGALVLWPAG
jgi:NADH:ubiquinone oxidoreductase subunit 5 (subunit L)/multisubunit Na+/H+ antiporter MnhA subunit